MLFVVSLFINTVKIMLMELDMESVFTFMKVGQELVQLEIIYFTQDKLLVLSQVFISLDLVELDLKISVLLSNILSMKVF